MLGSKNVWVGIFAEIIMSGSICVYRLSDADGFMLVAIKIKCNINYIIGYVIKKGICFVESVTVGNRIRRLHD